MKLFKLLLSSVTLVVMSYSTFAQTMTFNSGPTEPGFTLNNWTSAGGTIWHANLATPTTCSVNSGTWNFLSFDVGPFTGANTYEVTSNLGDSYTYSGNTVATHTLNWMGVTTVTFTRISGSGAAADHDNFVYSIPASCTDPTVPTLTQNPTTVCIGETASLNISGTLNDATAWQVYTGSCGGTNIGSTTTGTFTIPGTINTPTTFFVRGEGGCVTPGSCGSITITPQALDDASFSYSASSYCVNNADPTPTITGLPGGSFSSTAGLSINASTGAIDVSASTPGTYTVTYTTSGTCPNSSNVSVTINALDNASFNYSSAAYCNNASDPTPTITGLAGGTFSSTAGLSINASTGAIDVSASTPGTYTVTYTTSGTCPNSSNVSVTINSLDNASFNYSAAAYCVNDADPTPTITGLPGGSFSSTAGLSINASTGAIDVSASTPGTYTVTYTTAGSCPNSSNVSVTINALDNASFNYSAAAYCNNASDPTPTITGLAGGTFSSTAGLSINSSTGTIDVSASTPGTYTITYTTSGTCPNSATFGVTIDDVVAPVADVATLADLTDECEITSLTAPTATDNCVGTVTGTHGATLPITSTTTITWTYDDGNGNSSTQNQEVVISDNIAPLADIASLTTITAQCEITSLTAPTATDNCVGTITGTHGATLPITSSTTITWTYDDGNGNTSTQTQDIVINDVTGTDTQTACGSYTWIDGNTYTSDNNTATFNIVGGAASGCDSLVTLDLTITSGTNTNVDVVVNSTNDIVMIAENSNAQYQWLDCDDNYSVIAGANNQTYLVTQNGNYAVEITDGLCTDTSTCNTINSVSVDTYGVEEYKIYPNPTSGIVNIRSTDVFDKIEVLNAVGQIVYSVQLDQINEYQIQLPDEKGVYVIKVSDIDSYNTFRIVKN